MQQESTNKPSEDHDNWHVTQEGKILSVPLQRVAIARPHFAPPQPATKLPLPEEQTQLEDNVSAINYWTYTKLAASLMPQIFKMLYGAIMKNWKTTLGAFVGGIATVLNALGIVEISAEVQIACVSLGMFIVGLFAPDAKKNEQSN